MPGAQSNAIRSSAILTLTALIWGMAFVAQRSSMEFVGPFFFSGIRTLLGAATLAVILALTLALRRRKQLRQHFEQGEDEGGDSTAAELLPREASALSVARLLKAGILCGLVFFAASSLQQVGLVFTTASKAGFLTTLYIVLVPILGLFLRHRTHWNTWVSVLVAAVGLYLLSITSDFSMELGDAVTLVGALGWAGHILIIDHYVNGISRTEVMKLCVLQFMVCGLLSCVCAPLFDSSISPVTLTLGAIWDAMPAILYAGILSTGVAFTLQAVGQQHAKPSVAAVILSLEAVFSVLGGMLILHEILSGRELLGCVLMFVAVLLAQMPVAAVAQSKAQKSGST
ncbi:MAG: DMT family transporter [Coriobacteriales bacterium]|jgi:drug/metabolite transporter (DMT)-like permease|nr:DMT family transporter [Coriobacteriales bacterium]